MPQFDSEHHDFFLLDLAKMAAFCDLNDFARRSIAERYIRYTQRNFDHMMDMESPHISAIHGSPRGRPRRSVLSEVSVEGELPVRVWVS